jgi:hypothetical protein
MMLQTPKLHHTGKCGDAEAPRWPVWSEGEVWDRNALATHLPQMSNRSVEYYCLATTIYGTLKCWAWWDLGDEALRLGDGELFSLGLEFFSLFFSFLLPKEFWRKTLKDVLKESYTQRL